MNKIFKVPFFILLLVATLASCKKEGTELSLQKGSFPLAALNVSVKNVVLTSANENDSTLQVLWQAAAFGPTPVIGYTVQLDVASDTAGGKWPNAKNYIVDANKKNYSFLNKDLNNLLNGMNLTPGTPNIILFRIKADVNQYNGTASTVVPVYSNAMPVNITSYGLNLYVPGDYQGWDPASAPIFYAINGKPGLYEGYANFSGAGVHYFKFTNAPDWNHTNYGDGGGGTFDTNGAAGGLSTPGPGYYELTANLNNNTWTATPTTWGIIGDATPGGWNNDTQMAYDAASQTWNVTANMIHNGSFKFRANNAWNIDFGIDGTGKLLYADNPFLGYNSTLNNLTVPLDGNYTITLDLHISGNYTYILKKN